MTFHEMVVGKAYFEREFDDAAPSAVLVQTGDAEMVVVFFESLPISVKPLLVVTKIANL